MCDRIIGLQENESEEEKRESDVGRGRTIVYLIFLERRPNRTARQIHVKQQQHMTTTLRIKREAVIRTQATPRPPFVCLNPVIVLNIPAIKLRV